MVFVHAHPDDETIATGATIATLVDAGAAVTVLTCTRGELGEVIPSELRHLAGTELGAHRLGELDAALAALGVTDHRILGTPEARWADRQPRRYLDSGMQWGPTGAEALSPVDPESLSAADLGEVAADIAAVLVDVEPDVVVSYAADGGYGHPDHVRAHEATRRAAQVLGVPFYVVDSPGGRPGRAAVDPSASVLDRKRAALEAHRTQVSVSGDSFSLSSGEPRPIAARETFTRVHAPADGFSQNSLGSRIFAAILALVLGAFVGATLTAAHQATVQFGLVSVPWGIITALVLTAALLVGLRIVFDTRILAACAAIGILGVSAILALQTSGGSVLVPANTAGYAWTFGPVLITLLTLAWPRPVRPVRPVASGRRDIIEVPSVKGPDLP